MTEAIKVNIASSPQKLFVNALLTHDFWQETTQVETQVATGHANEQTQQVPAISSTTTEINPSQPAGPDTVEATKTSDQSDLSNGLFSTTTQVHAPPETDEEHTHTPKLSDVPDVDPTQLMDEQESTTEDLNDPSRHPAFAPHIHPQLTDDDDDEPMEAAYNHPEVTSTIPKTISSPSTTTEIEQLVDHEFSTSAPDQPTATDHPMPTIAHTEPNYGTVEQPLAPESRAHDANLSAPDSVTTTTAPTTTAEGVTTQTSSLDAMDAIPSESENFPPGTVSPITASAIVQDINANQVPEAQASVSSEPPTIATAPETDPSQHTAANIHPVPVETTTSAPDFQQDTNNAPTENHTDTTLENQHSPNQWLLPTSL